MPVCGDGVVLVGNGEECDALTSVRIREKSTTSRLQCATLRMEIVFQMMAAPHSQMHPSAPLPGQQTSACQRPTDPQTGRELPSGKWLCLWHPKRRRSLSRNLQPEFAPVSMAPLKAWAVLWQLLRR